MPILVQLPTTRPKLIGGTPCLDFVNTAGSRMTTHASSDHPRDAKGEETLRSYEDLLSWSRHAGIVTDAAARRLQVLARRSPTTSAVVLKRAIALRETLHRICIDVLHGRTSPRSNTQLLNEELAVARRHQRLVRSTNRYAWTWEKTKALDIPLWILANSAAQLFTTGDLSRIRECASDRCGWLFLDGTRNRSRHWCDMKDCGNTAKVRRFRQRERAPRKM